MNPMLKKLIDQEFMTENDANYLSEAIANGHSIIISGHRGHGILPLLATLGAVAKESGTVKPVRNIENDLTDSDANILLIGDLKDVDYSEALVRAFSLKDKTIITIKDAEHSFSVMKVLTDVFKNTGDTSKIYELAECTKEDDVKKLAKLVRVTLNEKGRPVRTTFQR